MFEDMLGKLQDMQQRMDTLKDRLENISVKGEASGGTVTVIMNGNKKLLNVDIRYDLIRLGDKEQIEDLVTVAVNRALEQAQNVADAESAAISRDLLPNGFPGLAV